jgi:hypothetical protein
VTQVFPYKAPLVKHVATERARYALPAARFLNRIGEPISALVTRLQPEQRNTRTASRSPIGDRSARCVIEALQASHVQVGGASNELTANDMTVPRGSSARL